MQLRTVPDNPLEALAMAANVVPRPVFDTLIAAGLARTVMVASKVGVFDALAGKSATTEEVAGACSTAIGATEHLLVALASCGYVTARAATGSWSLTAMARKWLVRDAPRSLHDHVMLMELVWRWLEHYEHFVRTGEALDVHRAMTDADWALYQRGMRSLASLSIDEFTLRTSVPAHAVDALDIGGSHGAYVGALCRKHRRLRGVVLDLPDASRHAAPLIAELDLGDRIRQWPGDALRVDLGRDAWDVVLVSNLVHHFDAATNAALIRRIAIALRPGGVVIVQEPMRTRGGGQIGGLGSLYFAALSASATWTSAELARWQRDAGLVPSRPRNFATVPGFVQQAATRTR